jgi:hypothetical protein
VAPVNVRLYPRTIDIHRIETNAGPTDAVIGLAGYSGAEATTSPTNPSDEAVLFTGIPASIQAKRYGTKNAGGLAADIVWLPAWDIFIPLSALAKGAVRDRDIIIDDEGYRYEVGQAYWNRLGYKIISIRLEA